MIFLNKLLAKVDLALIKRSRITKAEKELKKVTKAFQSSQKEVRQACNEISGAKKNSPKSLSLEEQLLSLPLLRPAGFPFHTTQVALILYARDLSKVTEIMAGQPQCRLEHIVLVDSGPDSPPRVPFADKDGDRSVPVGKLETLKQYPYLEFVFYQQAYSVEDSKSLYDYIEAIKKLQSISPQKICWIVSTIKKGWPISYLPHHYLTWKAQLTALYSDLADKESKEVMAQVIKARTTGNIGYYGLSNYLEYFHPAVPVRPGDVVFDAGVAARANPTTIFAELVSSTGHVYGFEPEPRNYAEATNVLRNHTNTTLLPLGLWHSEMQLSFRQSGGDSRVQPGSTGQNIIQVPLNSIDNIMEQKKIKKLDFIKMDIEGAEVAALKGAVSTLRTHKPNLAICLYHQGTDIFEIPNFIKKLNLGYKLYMGHHSPIMLDTILYASAR